MWQRWWLQWRDWWLEANLWMQGIAGVLALVVLALVGLSFYWSRPPEAFDVLDKARAETGQQEPVVGTATTAALIGVVETLLDKPGGYLRNDRLPPGLLLDNMPNWEFGALVQVRDLAKSLRNDFSRSQTQSLEDKDLAFAEPQFNVDASSWLIPRPEKEYRKGVDALKRYLARLSDPGQQQAQFYARADNLEDWLGVVEKRLGSLSQRLSASVGRPRLNTDLAGDSAAEQSTVAPKQVNVQTPWLEIDDVFFEARGSCWALLHFLQAVDRDFGSVLEKKNARVSLRQIIRELEPTQDPIWSPMILNGTGFGLTANHSLVMASYISRANAAVIDLRNLLDRG